MEEYSIMHYFTSSLPFWAIPLAFILLEVGNRNRMRREMVQAGTAFFVSFCLLALTGAFLYFGGYKDSLALLKLFTE